MNFVNKEGRYFSHYWTSELKSKLTQLLGYKIQQSLCLLTLKEFPEPGNVLLIMPILIGCGTNYITGPFSPPQTVLIQGHQVTESSRSGVAAWGWYRQARPQQLPLVVVGKDKNHGWIQCSYRRQTCAWPAKRTHFWPMRRVPLEPCRSTQFSVMGVEGEELLVGDNLSALT